MRKYFVVLRRKAVFSPFDLWVDYVKEDNFCLLINSFSMYVLKYIIYHLLRYYTTRVTAYTLIVFVNTVFKIHVCIIYQLKKITELL